MLQRGMWLVGMLAVVGCSSARETGSEDARGSNADAAGGGGVDAFWPASSCPGATDVANVGVVTQQHVNLPQLVRAGARTGIVWTGTTATTWEVKLAWLDDAMQAVPGTTRTVSPDDGVFTAFGRIAWSGTELGVVYADARNGDQHHDVYFARLDASGAPIAGSEVGLCTADQQCEFPSVVWDPVDAQWGVAWQEFGDSMNRVSFARLDQHGALIAGSKIVVAGPHSVIDDAGAGPLIWTGTHWAVASASDTAFVISEIPALGGPVHDITIAETPDNFELGGQIASDGARYLLGRVTWANGENQLRISLVDEHGVVPGTLTTLGAAAEYSGEPSIAWNGSQFAVSFRVAAHQQNQIAMALFDAHGALVPGSERELTCDAQLNGFDVASWHDGELDIVYAAQDPSGYSEIDRPEVNDLRVLRVPAASQPQEP